MALLSTWWFLAGWLVLTIPSLVILIRDLRSKNAHLMSLMKVVWALTVVYSGPVGLAVYWLTGRKEISDDGIWRRGARSVAHCYSGCGMGEIIGVTVAVGVIAAPTWGVALITFTLAFTFGILLTVGPMMQEGTKFRPALKDALIAETPSIVVMEAVAIGSDILISGDATIGEPLFWSALIVSLSFGLLAAYPVNVMLIRFGIKEGMMDPRMTGD
ncbi:hypothetical protein PARPLA_01203 [Rhodobacteraceae bacterium THAF1]|uniref:DUF4396 domain-containing protein n=1 Tax=Palleronia sp. THAF1 TaxID=2587842 RepID=UPI000F3B260C|nr:DUF4396 domain-containing protein [Palleronia sp. THAF1]QFU07274.1 hypothetical protein FIU81_01165 [Palleronia sp. THAF1]VDC20814.1 hypothetical protein PARPLA_01203 [Rhodobacteraceae bacterium THAF1]